MARLTDSFFSTDAVDTPYWWEAAKPTAPAAAEMPDSTEVTIIGGGFTGLNAAMTMAKAAGR